MRSRVLVLALALSGPVPAAAQRAAADPSPATITADALRERAVGLLDGAGPADIALAQLTRAALLDPAAPETWSALRRGAEQMSTRRSGFARVEAFLLERLPGAALPLREFAARLSVPGAAWPAALPGWAAAAAIVTLVASLGLAWRVRRRQAQRPMHPVTGTRGRVVLPGGQVEPQPAAPPPAPHPTAPAAGDRTRSADEQALVAWLTRRRAGAGGSADPGILARA